MAWRTGSKLFVEIWPLLVVNIPDRAERIDFTARILRLFVEEDMDTYDVEDVHADIRAALKVIGEDLVEPERYEDDPKVH
jgi:hypothetical protein